MLIKLHPLIKVENLPYLKMLPPRNLSLSDGECGHVVVCLRVSEELGDNSEDVWVQRVTTFLLFFFFPLFFYMAFCLYFLNFIGILFWGYHLDHSLSLMCKNQSRQSIKVEAWVLASYSNAFKVVKKLLFCLCRSTTCKV